MTSSMVLGSEALSLGLWLRWLNSSEGQPVRGAHMLIEDGVAFQEYKKLVQNIHRVH